MLHSLNQKNVLTSLCVARIKWCEKAKRKFAHLEGWESPKGQTFRFTLCLWNCSVFHTMTASFILSGTMGGSAMRSAQDLTPPCWVWNSPWAQLRCYGPKPLMCQAGLLPLASFHTPLWRACVSSVPCDQCHADGREWRSSSTLGCPWSHPSFHLSQP